jgi:hypothetical protein
MNNANLIEGRGFKKIYCQRAGFEVKIDIFIQKLRLVSFLRRDMSRQYAQGFLKTTETNASMMRISTNPHAQGIDADKKNALFR